MATNKTKDRFKEIEELAVAAGLRHYDVQFFEVPTSVIYEVASYGLPTRYSHWSFGKTYQFQKIHGEMGHSKIYELILNNNPAYAFLDTSNTETINLMIAGHCYLPGTYVQTSEGIKIIEDVKSGDYVYSHKGRLCKVIAPTCNVTEGEVVSIQAGSYRFAQTADHKLYAVQTSPDDRKKYHSWGNAFNNMDYSSQWVESGKLKPGDFLVVNKPKLNQAARPFSIPIKKTLWKQKYDKLLTIQCDEGFGELIGLYLAEGYARPKGQMGLCFSGDETELHDRSTELIKKYFGLTARVKHSSVQNAATVEFNEICIAAYLRDKLGHSCYVKHLPGEWITDTSTPFLRGVLKGFLLGDGSKTQPRNMGFTTTSPKLAMQMQQIGMHLGIFFGINPRNKSTPDQPRAISFDGSASGIYDNKVRELLSLPVRKINRTWSGVIEGHGCFYVKINEISTEEYSGIVHCLNVEEDHSFTLANGIVTHNCFGHADFFANNIMFREAQEENMVQVAKRHAEAIDQYRKDYGDDEVDEWLDVALGMEHHIDVYKKLRRVKYPKRHIEFHEREIGEWEDLHANDDPLVKRVVEGAHMPPQPEKDLLWFLTEYANMEDWQKRIFEIVRRESYYFYPQYRTKTMSEGWACLSGNSKVLTQKGLINISDYINADYEKVECHSGNELVRRSNVHITDKKEGLRIRTNRCITIECALNHKVKLASGEFKKAKDLQINDRLMTSLGQDLWSDEYQKVNVGYTKRKCATLNVKKIASPVVIDEKFAEFIAFWLGEGCIYKDRGIFLRNKDREQLIEFSDFLFERFSINSSIQTTDPGTVSERYNLEIYSVSLFSLLNVITGDIKRKSRQKRIPDIIFKSPRTVVVAFLQYLFDAEGCCYISKDARQKIIILASSSLDMLSDVSILLSNLGIYGAYAVSKKEGYRDTHQLRIGSKCCRKFQNEINFKNTKKANKLVDLVSLSDSYKCEEFSCKVISIEKIEDVFFDFTVPGDHTYVANGIVHHNSYWHAELMMQYALGDDNDYGVKGIKYPLTSEEHLDFLSSHEKVVQAGVKIPLKVDQPEMVAHGRPTGRTIKDWHPRIIENPNLFYYATRINPYYVGFRMFRDIKERWDRYYKEGFYEDEWGKKINVTIDGNQKIRQVMESEDDVSFFRNYLTEDLCDKLHLFAFGSPESYNDNYKVQEEIKKRIRENSDRQLGNSPIDEQLKANKTVQVRTKNVEDIVRTIARVRNNYGVPCIVVRRVDSDGTLRLEHVEDDLTNVDIGYGEHTLQYVFRVWGRPVELIRKNADHTHVMKYDASGFSLDYATSDYPESIEDKDSASSW